MRNFLTLEDEVVPMHHPRALGEVAKSQGASLAELLEHTQISEPMLSHPEARISYLRFGILALNAMRLTNNPGLGLDFGKRVHLSNLGLVGLLVLSSKTAEDALRGGMRFAPLTAPAWQLSLEVDGDIARVHAVPQIPFGTLQAFATESLLAAMSEQTRFVLGEAPPILGVWLDYPAPAHVARYDELGSCPLHFEQPAIKVEFDARVLRREIKSADPLTREVALRHCEAELAAVTNREGLVPCVRALLELRPGEYADLPSVARTLHTTPRTLRRELKRLGTSYQTLLDDVRREHVLDYLSNTKLTVDEIAGKLGLSDVRSLRRAVRRWTGLAPAAFRASAAK